MIHTVDCQDASIPALGFGTFRLDDPTARRMVKHALSLGYRHIDTAQLYKNEEAVGAAIAASEVARQDIFLTTKVWIDKFDPRDLRRSVETSIKKLGTEPNLLLLHWPNPKIPLEGTLKALAEVKRAGLTDHIGVSNFTVALLKEAVELCPEPLVTNQVEYHPYLDQRPVIEACQSFGMSLTAYSPLAQGKLLDDPVLTAIGDQHGKSAAQVALRWQLQQPDTLAIPRTSSEENARANFDVTDFTLTDEQMAAIDDLKRPDGRVVNPPIAPEWDT
jgi:diketogulonate reductase-like aldo/keto reductase